jgi:hypothetical protein
VIRGGRLLAVTTPAAARAELQDTIFEGTVEPAALEPLRHERCVIQGYLVEGRNRVRIHEPGGTPPPSFAPVAPTLEDAYLVMMQGRAPRRRPAEDAATAMTEALA